MKKVASFSLILVLLFAFTLAGCSGDKTENLSTSSPNAGSLNPTGTIQGVLTDASTQQPIVNATVSIGVGSAVTDGNGQFVIYNVPATTDALNGTVNGSYNMTINMKNVTSPVNMADTTVTPRYSDFAFTWVNVQYTSLNDTSGTQPGAGSGSNHDTPVTGLVASITPHVGKLSANISGVVADSNTLQPVAAGYVVELVSTGSSISQGSTGGTGNTGNLIDSTTTDANGAFTFSNVEAMQTFTIRAKSADGQFAGSSNVTTLSDGETTTLSIQESTAILVYSTDILAPSIVSVTPENGSDITPAATDVVFTFSEPIKQTAYSMDVTGSNLAGLWDDVDVEYNGTKAGNIAHTISWDPTYTVLTVSIPTLAASSSYTVNICNATANLVDNNDHPVSNGCGTANFTIVNFTTNGGTTAAAPTIVLLNSDSMGATGTGTPSLDWLPVSGAIGYNIYRATNVVWADGTTQPGSYELMDTALVSNWAEPGFVNFVGNDQVKLTYSYVVKSINTDYIESDASNAVTAEDKIGPEMSSVAGAAGFVLPANNGDTNTYTVTVTFVEPVDEATAVDLANYTVAATAAALPTDVLPVITAAVYDPTTNSVDLTMTVTTTDNLVDTYSNNWVLDVSSNVTDVAGNAILATGDEYDVTTNTIQ